MGAQYGPEDFEIGDEPIEMRRAERPSMMLSVRLNPEETQAVRQFARTHKLSFSQLVRAAIMAYLRAGNPNESSSPARPQGTIGEPGHVEWAIPGTTPVNKTEGTVPRELVMSTG